MHVHLSLSLFLRVCVCVVISYHIYKYMYKCTYTVYVIMSSPHTYSEHVPLVCKEVVSRICTPKPLFGELCKVIHTYAA